MTSLAIQSYNTENSNLETSTTQHLCKHPLQCTQNRPKALVQQYDLTAQAMDECCSFRLDRNLCAFVCMCRLARIYGISLVATEWTDNCTEQAKHPDCNKPDILCRYARFEITRKSKEPISAEEKVQFGRPGCSIEHKQDTLERTVQDQAPDYVEGRENNGTGLSTASRRALETVVDVARCMGSHRQHKDCGTATQQSCSVHDEHAALLELLGRLRTSDCKSYDVFADQCGSTIPDIRLHGVSAEVDSYFQQMLQMYGWDNLTGDVKDVTTSFMTAWISLMDHCMKEPSSAFIESEARIQRGSWSTYHEECKHSAWRYERVGHKEAFHMAEVNYGWLHAHSIDSDSHKLCNPKRKATETLLALDFKRVMTGADVSTVQHINDVLKCISEAEDIEPVSHCGTLCLAMRAAVRSTIPKCRFTSTSEQNICGHCVLLTMPFDAGLVWPARVEHGVSDARIMLTRGVVARVVNDLYDWKSDCVRGEPFNSMRFNSVRPGLLRWLAESLEHAILCKTRNHDDLLIGIGTSSSYAVLTGRSLLLERLYAEDMTPKIRGYECCASKHGAILCDADPIAHVYVAHGEWAIEVEDLCIRVSKMLGVNAVLTTMLWRNWACCLLGSRCLNMEQSTFAAYCKKMRLIVDTILSSKEYSSRDVLVCITIALLVAPPHLLALGFDGYRSELLDMMAALSETL